MEEHIPFVLEAQEEFLTPSEGDERHFDEYGAQYMLPKACCRKRHNVVE